jgi:ubiquinone/menaquinone biosynthesis C-methylase UbiE
VPVSAVESLFRLWSPFYDLQIFQRTFYRPIHRKLLRRLDGLTPARVVDLGCGTAQLTEDLVRCFPEAQVTGLDLSAEMLAAARTRMGQSTPPLVRANVYALPFAGGSIDLITSSISYHWYKEPRRALAEIARVLSPRGRFVLATVVGWPRAIDFKAFRFASLEETRENMIASGLRVIETSTALPMVTIFETERST